MIRNLFNLEFILGIGFILYWFAWGVATVGDLPKCANKPYPAWLPFALLFMVGLPFVLGWIAGNNYK